jgi:hypothetical protein
MAEGVGFEPTRAFALPVFKTGAINHSTTPPDRAAQLSRSAINQQGGSSAPSLGRIARGTADPPLALQVFTFM